MSIWWAVGKDNESMWQRGDIRITKLKENITKIRTLIF